MKHFIIAVVAYVIFDWLGYNAGRAHLARPVEIFGLKENLGVAIYRVIQKIVEILVVVHLYQSQGTFYAAAFVFLSVCFVYDVLYYIYSWILKVVWKTAFLDSWNIADLWKSNDVGHGYWTFLGWYYAFARRPAKTSFLNVLKSILTGEGRKPMKGRELVIQSVVGILVFFAAQLFLF